MKHDPKKNELSERRLDRAAKHVTSLWFPINPDLLATIRANFESGIYDREPAALLDTLKKDFALFTFIVKKLVSIASQEGVRSAILDNPAVVLCCINCLPNSLTAEIYCPKFLHSE